MVNFEKSKYIQEVGNNGNAKVQTLILAIVVTIILTSSGWFQSRIQNNICDMQITTLQNKTTFVDGKKSNLGNSELYYAWQLHTQSK